MTRRQQIDSEDVRRYRITGRTPGEGAEFEAPANATEEEIAKAAFNCVVEYLSYGWEEVEE
jgi:hypothetical protein